MVERRDSTSAGKYSVLIQKIATENLMISSILIYNQFRIKFGPTLKQEVVIAHLIDKAELDEV